MFVVSSALSQKAEEDEANMVQLNRPWICVHFHVEEAFIVDPLNKILCSIDLQACGSVQISVRTLAYVIPGTNIRAAHHM